MTTWPFCRFLGCCHNNFLGLFLSVKVRWCSWFFDTSFMNALNASIRLEVIFHSISFKSSRGICLPALYLINYLRYYKFITFYIFINIIALQDIFLFKNMTSIWFKSTQKQYINFPRVTVWYDTSSKRLNEPLTFLMPGDEWLVPITWI